MDAYVGREVKKAFEGEEYQGEVIKYDPKDCPKWPFRVSARVKPITESGVGQRSVG